MSKQRGKSSRFQHRVPTLETLESRILTTVESLEYQLLQLNSSQPPAAPEVASQTRLINQTVRNNTAVRMTRDISVNMSQTTVDRSISLSTLAADPAGERNLVYRWTLDSAPNGGGGTFSANSSNAAKNTRLTVTKAGEYRVTVTATNNLRQSTSSSMRFVVTPAATRLEVLTSNSQAILPGSTVNSASNVQSLRLRTYDQFGHLMTTSQSFNVSAKPISGVGVTTITTRGEFTDVAVDRLGRYQVVVSTGKLSTIFNLNVMSSLSRVEIVAPTQPLAANSTTQLVARAYDQFGALVAGNFTQQWSASVGTITSNGLYTAPATSTTVNVTMRSGNLTASVTLNVAGATVSNQLSNRDIANLFTQYFADGSINRTEMMAILRLPGRDGIVDAVELGDLMHIVNNGRLYNIADYVQNLASDVVNGNRGNQTFQGRPLGNLTPGSSAAQLNTLIDKWFLGADVPVLTSTSYSYQTALGNLFSGTPSFLDQKQGMLGDCYLIASLGSIAMVNPTAITNMFIDNGDGTFTVRFFGGSYGSFFNPDGTISDGFASGTQGQADYVTVDRRLPVFSGSRFAYSNYGNDYRSANNVLWIALIEKAYAQWNQTGNAGRNGANTYAAIEGGWMATVYAQLLGRNSTNYWFNNTQKQVLVNALRNGQAVTLGTKSGPMANGLVQGHAYMVRSYDAATDRFLLHNPWGTTHPTPLNYSQLQQFCSVFVVANPVGTTPAVQAQGRTIVRNDFPMEALLFTLPTRSQQTIESSYSGDMSHLLLDLTFDDDLRAISQPQIVSSQDSEMQLLVGLSREIEEIQASLSDIRIDRDLAIAVDELFSNEEFFYR
jgi:hypothetical protein